MKYSIIIPTFNHCDDLLKPCMESVFKHTHMGEVELIVVANGCTDNTSYYLTRIKNQFDRLGFSDHFKVITHDEPLGFAAACNQGILQSKGGKIILLNNDCVLLDQPHHAWLNRLNAPFEQDPLMGITCTLMLHSEETQESFAPFFCVMIDRKVVEQVGLLNETYQVGGVEDMEYCYLTQQAGYKIQSVDATQYNSQAQLHVGDFPLYHKGEGTMHDASLVPNWQQIFQANKQKLVTKLTSSTLTAPPLCASVSEVEAKYIWLSHMSPQGPELFKEVIQTNTYLLEPHHVQGVSVIDVGANMGMFSILCAALGAPQVWACEPINSTYELLQTCVNRAQLHEQISCVRAAIVGALNAGPIMMGTHDDSGKNSLYDMGSQAELVPSKSLADVVSMCTQDRILLKMDCEGAEYDILLDAANHTFDRIHMIMMETHGDLHPVHKDIPILHHRLAELGFTQKSFQPYGIWWYDASGTPVKWEPLNMSIELWSK